MYCNFTGLIEYCRCSAEENDSSDSHCSLPLFSYWGLFIVDTYCIVDTCVRVPCLLFLLFFHHAVCFLSCAFALWCCFILSFAVFILTLLSS